MGKRPRRHRQPRGRVSLEERSDGEVHLLDCADAEWVLICAENGVGLFRRENFAEIQPVSSMDNLVTLHRARLVDARPSFWIAARDRRRKRSGTATRARCRRDR